MQLEPKFSIQIFTVFKKKNLVEQKIWNINFQNQYFISIPPPAKIDKWIINKEWYLYYKEL